MSVYFRGHSGITWATYSMFPFGGSPSYPDDYPIVDIPYPAGIQAGDLLIAMSWDAIVSGDSSYTVKPIDTTKWTPMGPLVGYRYPPGLKGHYAYWCIADGTESGSLSVETAAGLSDFWDPAGVTHGHMQAWAARSVGAVSWAYAQPSGGHDYFSFGSFGGVEEDVSIAPYLLGSIIYPSGTPITCSDVTMADFGNFTEEFETTDQYTLSQYGWFSDTTQYWFGTYSFGAGYYVVPATSIPAQTFTFNPSDNPYTGSSAFGFEGLHLGYLAALAGYWGILAEPL